MKRFLPLLFLASILPGSMLRAAMTETNPNHECQIGAPRAQANRAITYFYVSRKATMENYPQVTDDLLDRFGKAAKLAGIGADGPETWRYLMSKDSKSFMIEIGAEVDPKTKPAGDAKVKKIKAFDSLSVVFIGALKDLGKGYAAMDAALKEKGLEKTREVRELYLHFQGENTPDNVAILQYGLTKKSAKKAREAGLMTDYQIGEMRDMTLAGFDFLYDTEGAGYDNVPKAFDRAGAKLSAGIAKAKIPTGYKTVAIYQDTKDASRPLSLQIGRSVDTGTPSPDGLSVRSLKPFRCAGLVYCGGLSHLTQAIRQLESAIQAKGLPNSGDYREYYLHWEGDESPNNVMLIQMGLKEEGASAPKDAAPRTAKLDGVPKIGYGIRMCPFPGSLESVMRYMGDPQDYDYLMGVTGAAFRRFWDKDDGGNVDLMYLEPEVSKRAFEALGYDYRVIPAKDKGEMLRAIKESIAKGRPVLACGIIGPPECGIVAGYDDDGETLLGYSYFQDASIPGYYRKSKWFEESSWGTGLLVIGEKKEKPSPRQILVRSLEWAIDLERTPRRKNHDCGLAAYDGWASGLEKDADYPKDDSKVMETRAMVHGDQCAMLEDRKEGAKYLRRMAKVAPEAAEDLNAAADHFEGAAKRMDALWPWGIGPASKTDLANPEFRRKMAKSVREAKIEEERGVERLEKALVTLKTKPAN